ncbi:MAG: sensor domain-containing diguanylate cyclase [Nitrospirota bacterium]|nr:sensor domain-containing diguanylate cyclase [Nitrospirota bacterium]
MTRNSMREKVMAIPEFDELRNHKELGDLQHRLEEKVLELYTLYEINKALNLSMSLDDLFGVAMTLLGNSLHISEYCLLLLDEQSQDLVIRASHGLSEEATCRVRFGPGEGISWQAFSIGEPIIVQDVTQEAAFLYYKGYKTDVGSFISVPLKLKDGRVIGVLNAHRPEKNSFSLGDEELFCAVAENVAIAIDRARVYEKTRELSIRDPLTNLYNRRYFFEYADREVERGKRYDHPLSVILIDIDDFKNYNDVNGHLEGDAALKKTAVLLEKNLRKGDVLARYGGEEFIVLLPETGSEAAMGVAEKLREAVYNGCYHGRETQPLGRVSITLGVSSFPCDSDDLVRLIGLADCHLYMGKAQGKNRVIGGAGDPAGQVKGRLRAHQSGGGI